MLCGAGFWALSEVESWRFSVIFSLGPGVEPSWPVFFSGCETVRTADVVHAAAGGGTGAVPAGVSNAHGFFLKISVSIQ